MRVPRAKRLCLIAALSACACLLLAGVGFADSTADTVARANGMAYANAMKCFVANGHARGLRNRAGDAAKAAVYEANARQSFDVAVKLGHALGFSGDRIQQDFGLAQTKELPDMMRDDNYFIGVVATCKALGLM